MEKIFLAAFAVIMAGNIIAQQPTPPQPNGNIINPSLDKFVGTWVWVSGNDTLRIILKKENILLPFPENSRADLLIGFHIYKKGNTVIESSISNSSSSYIDKQYTILGGNRAGIDNSEITCSIKNLSKNKSGELKLSINSSNSQLSWNLKNREGVKIGNYDYTFSYLLSLTLQKP